MDSSMNRSSLIINRQEKKSVLIQNQFGGISSYFEEEFELFSELVNTYLSNDKDLDDIMPLNMDDKDSLLEGCQNGILICKLINVAVPGTIMVKAINTGKDMNIFKINENLRLAINSAKSIGCILQSTSVQNLYNKQISAILGMLWQILRIKSIYDMNLRDHPEIVKLKKENESLEDFMALKPEDFIIRWINYHMEIGGYPNRIKNITSDLKGGEVFTLLLSQLQPSCIDKDKVLNEQDLTQKGKYILDSAGKLGVPKVIKSEQLCKGSHKTNLIFLTQLFVAKNGLKDDILDDLDLQGTQELNEQIQEFKEQVQNDQDDNQGSREERQFRLWVNGLDIDGVRLMNLFADIKVDVVLLQVMDRVIEGSIDWSKVESNPNNKFKKLQNANYAIKVAKEVFKFHLVGIGGQDLVEGNKKLTLALIWQLVYKHTMMTIGGNDEKQLLNWANNKVRNQQIKSLSDKSLKNSLFLFELLGSVVKGSYDENEVYSDESKESYINNAQYLLSCARKCGAVIFLVHEDILEIRSKMMIVLFAELNRLDKHGPRASTRDIIGKKIDV